MAQSAQDETHSSRIRVAASGFTVPSGQAWEYYKPGYDLTPIKAKNSVGLFVSRAWVAGPCFFGEQAFDANAHNRTQQHIRNGEPIISVNRYITGGIMGLNRDEPFTARPGAIIFRDYAEPFSGIQVPSLNQGIYISPKVVGFDRRRARGTMILSGQSTMARVIHSEFDYFFSEFAQDASSINAARLNRLVSVLTVASLGASAPRDVRTEARDALGDVIRKFIEHNLALPTLSPALILKEYGVSRATLYRIFEADGGVRNYIRSRRLFRAVFDISTNPRKRGQIAHSAERWGFSSASNFQRSVQDVYGTRPGSLFEHPLKKDFSKRETSILPPSIRGFLSRLRYAEAPAAPS